VRLVVELILYFGTFTPTFFCSNVCYRTGKKKNDATISFTTLHFTNEIYHLKLVLHPCVSSETDGGGDSLENVGNYLHTDTADRPRIFHCIQAPLKLQMLQKYINLTKCH